MRKPMRTKTLSNSKPTAGQVILPAPLFDEWRITAMKLREKLNLMRKIDETNRTNVDRWEQAMSESVTGFVIDPVAGSTEVVRFLADDLPELFGLDGKDDIQQVEILLDKTRLTMLYREVPCKPVSVIGYNWSMTGTVIVVRQDGGRFVDLTKDDIGLIRRHIDTVYGLHGYPQKILSGCSV